MKAHILDNDGKIARTVETTKQRAKEKGWVIADDYSATDPGLTAMYEKHQEHPNAAKAHEKVTAALASLKHPEQYCKKTAFLGYLAQMGEV